MKQKLDSENIVPLYFQLTEILKEKIVSGVWEEEQQLPSERQLIEMFDVSRATVKRALDKLVIDGLVYRKQGIGSFVSKPKIEQSLIGELSFNQQVTREGSIPSSEVVYAAVEENVSKSIMDVFQLDKEDKIFKVIRVRKVNDEPLILETLLIPCQHAPNLLKQDLKKIAVFEYLEKECNLKFTHSTLDIEPVVMNEFYIKYLHTKKGVPGLSLERTIYSSNAPIIIQERIMRGDRGRFVLTLGEESQNEEEFSLGFGFKKSIENK